VISLVITDSRWILYGVLVGALGLSLVRSYSEAAMFRVTQGLLCVVVPALLPFTLQSLLNRWLGVGHEGAGSALETLEIDAVVVVGFAALAIIASSRRTRGGLQGLELVVFSSVTIGAVLSLFNSYLGDAVLRTTHQKYTFLLAVTLIVVVLDHAVESGLSTDWTSRSRVRLVRFIFVCLAFLLAIRIDGLRAAGSWFHVAYFSGVVESVKAGGVLLWDTPSQYGFLNLLIPSLIPSLEAEQSLLIFQAALLFLIPCAVFITLWDESKSIVGVFLGFCYLLLMHFMNPALMGPQAFPSSSVMRFGPSVIVLLLVSKLCTRKNGVRINLTSVFVSVALLWSFESLYYSLLTLLGAVVGARSKAPDAQHVYQNIRKTIWRSLIYTSIFVILYSTYVLFRVGGFPSWSWFWLAATKYAGGFGSLPTDLSGAALVAMLGIAVAALGAFYASLPIKPVFTSCTFTLMAWFSYYIGRSHSANILALLPGIFLAISLPLVYSNWYSGSGSRSGRRLTRAAHTGLCFSVSSVFLGGLIINPSFPSLIANYRPLPLTAQFEDGAVFPQDLLLLFESVDSLSRLPIAYQGNLGILPDPPIELTNTIDKEIIWLPKPLALLEFPFPETIREVVLERRVKRFSPHGYFVWHKSESVQGHGEMWKEALKRHFSCRVVTSNNNWEISECKSLRR